MYRRRMHSCSAVWVRTLTPLLGQALVLSCWIVRRSWAGWMDVQRSRTLRLQALVVYLSVQNKLSVLTSVQWAGRPLALPFAVTE